MRAKRVRWVLGACVALLGCGGASESAHNSDAGEPASDAAPDEVDANAEAEPESDAAVGSEADPTTQDRCLRPGCGPARLPEQPSLEFLGAMGDGWQRLMEAEWELAPNSEGYRCMTLTLPQDVFVTAFSPQSPVGTHHATFGISPQASGPDAVVACGVGASGTRRLQGSGAGSEPSYLPEGVAMPLRKGEQVLMNLHLFNVGQTTVRGRSGMWIKTTPAAQVKVEAEAVLAGPLSLTIPMGRSVQRGHCTLRADATIYGVSPHMHQTGVHLRATAQTATSEVMMYDGNYDFSHQLFQDIDDVQLKRGDIVNVECTYQNDSNHTINWGDSSLDEMCFVGLGLYPAIGYGGLPCSN